jgi:uncharacterized protein
MITIISPAKSMDVETPSSSDIYSLPDFLPKSETLVKKLKKYSPKQLSGLMGISMNLAQLNYDRFQEWNMDFLPQNSKQAIFAFHGEVYSGIEATNFTPDDLDYAQKHLRILSGLYGLLRPLDLIMAYRLEMGTKISINKTKNLYEFWKHEITTRLKEEIPENSTVINLASQEYFKVIDTPKLGAKIITPIFKEEKNGEFKIISTYAKKARGEMTAFVMKNKITDPEEIKHFDASGYYYNDRLSTPNAYVFTRG